MAQSMPIEREFDFGATINAMVLQAEHRLAALVQEQDLLQQCLMLRQLPGSWQPTCTLTLQPGKAYNIRRGPARTYAARYLRQDYTRPVWLDSHTAPSWAFHPGGPFHVWVVDDTYTPEERPTGDTLRDGVLTIAWYQHLGVSAFATFLRERARHRFPDEQHYRNAQIALQRLLSERDPSVPALLE